MKPDCFARRFRIQGGEAFDRWHDEKLSLITVANSQQNLARLHDIFAFHSNLLQNITAFLPGNFQIDVLTQPFAASAPAVLAGQPAAAAESIFGQYLAFLDAAREWGMDFIDFSKFQILPGATLRFGWDLDRHPFPSPAAFLPIFGQNRHLRNLDEHNYLDVIKRTTKKSLSPAPAGYLYRGDDFTSNLLHARSLNGMKANAAIRIHTTSPWQKPIIRNNLSHALNGEELLLLKMDLTSVSLRDLISDLCGRKKNNEENPSTQVREFRSFLQQSVFQKTVLLIDNLAKKEDIRLLRFLLEAGDIQGLTLILFNDSAPFDCDLELHEDPPDLLQKYLPALFSRPRQPGLNKKESELFKKIALIEVPVPVAVARFLAGRDAGPTIAGLLNKQYLAEIKNQQTLSLNSSRPQAGASRKEKKELLELLAAETDWVYAKVSRMIDGEQWAVLEQFLKNMAAESPGLVAPGPAAELIVRYLPQLAQADKILEYFMEILIQSDCLPLQPKSACRICRPGQGFCPAESRPPGHAHERIPKARQASFRTGPGPGRAAGRMAVLEILLS